MEDDSKIIVLPSGSSEQDGIVYKCSLSVPPLGCGGMGRVFQGKRITKNGEEQDVAIKFMYDDLPKSAVERAKREASIRLRNDHLIEMLDFIEVEEKDKLGGTICRGHIVSELLLGLSLSKLMEGETKDQRGYEHETILKHKHLYKENRRIFAIEISKAILSGLVALHDAGYIHRDLDPSNVMLVADGRVKIIDFGLATTITRDRISQFSRHGQMIAKPIYAAPEVITGDINIHNVTTDIYSVGCMLYELMVGKPLYNMPDHEIIAAKSLGKTPSLSLIKDKGIRDIISKAVKMKQKDRYQSASEMRVALENLGQPKPPYQMPWKYIGTGIAFVAVLVLVVLRIIGIEDKGELITGQMKEYTIAEADSMLLRSKDDAESGVQILDSLSFHNAEAAYRMSELYREIPKANPVSRRMRTNASVTANQKLANEKLFLALRLDSLHMMACLDLAQYYIDGNGLNPDTAQASVLLRRVQAFGDSQQQNQAMRILSIMRTKTPSK